MSAKPCARGALDSGRRILDSAAVPGPSPKPTRAADPLQRLLQRIDPDQRVLASLDRRSAELLGGIEPALDRFAAIDGCLVAVEKSLLSATLALCLARLGRDRLGAWVPNEPDDIAHWLRQPIRQITTDRPDLALAARSASV